METRKRMHCDEHPDTLTNVANLAHTYKAQDCKNKAIQLMKTVIHFQKETIGPDHPQTKLSTSTLAL